MESSELFKRLRKAVIDFNDEEARVIATDIVKENCDVIAAIEALREGMLEVAKMYEDKEVFMSEIVLSSEAMYSALDILAPHVGIDEGRTRKKVVVGTIEGDVHDIGKNILEAMLIGAGFRAIDLGRDVPVEKFVSAVVEHSADAVAISTLMTTPMANMERVAKALYERGLAPRVKIAVGGAPVSREYANRIGAHIYAPDAIEAVELFKKILKVE